LKKPEPASRTNPGARLPGAGGTAALLLLILVAGLVVYKSTGALRQVDYVRATGTLSSPAALVPTSSTVLPIRVAEKSLDYLDAVWVALAFGILISAAVRAFTPVAALSRLFDRRPLQGQVVACALGAPLMLCSCCVAPIFSSVYQRSRRLAPSLAIMLAAPTLNPAALLLTFLLFPSPVAWGRLWMGVTAVVAGTLGVAWLAGRIDAHDVPVSLDAGDQPHESSPRRFVRSCIDVSIRTVPIILVGVVVAVLVADRVSLESSDLPSLRIWAIAMTAGIALPLALPTFFEIPLAATLLAGGAPAGVAAAFLFVGPAVNLPSLLTVGRATGWKAALTLAAMVWSVAFLGGLLVG